MVNKLFQKIAQEEKISPKRRYFAQMVTLIRVFNLRIGENLIFDPIRVGDGGTYFCSARNEVGSSDEISVTFDVFHPPKAVKTVPERRTELVSLLEAEF